MNVMGSDMLPKRINCYIMTFHFTTIYVYFCKFKKIADAFESSRRLCDQYYLASPELRLIQVNGKIMA